MKKSMFGSALILAGTITLVCAIVVATTTAHVKVSEKIAATTTGPEQPLAERVVDLPEDGQAYHLSVFVEDDWRARPTHRRLVAWFDADPRLVSLKTQTHWHLTTRSDPNFARFSAAVTALPAVVIQSGDGRVVYKVSGDAVPTTGEALSAEVGKIFPNRPTLFPWNRPNKPCPGPNCPKPEPPKPEPSNVNVNVVPTVPDVKPEPEGTSPVVPICVVGGIIAVLAGIGLAWHRQY